MDQRALGQLANDLVECRRDDRGCTRPLDRCVRFVHDLDVKVGCAESDLAFLGFDQDIGKDRNRVPTLDNRLCLGDRLEK